MPLITDFERMETTSGSLQPSQVVARYKVFARDGGPIFQIDSGGSADRKIPGKTSQTFQLDRKAAEKLWLLLGREFGLK